MAISIGYTRVSTLDQASEGVSLDAQRAKIEAWCTLSGRKLDELRVDAISGGKIANRPELLKALARVCEKKRRGDAGTRGRGEKSSGGNVLIVYSLSRLARNAREALEISEQLQKAGAALVSLTEEINTASAAGKMIYAMLAAFAEFERNLIRERTSMALQHMRSQGLRVGGIPYGYQLNPSDPTRLEPVAPEQAVIETIISARKSDLTLRAIAAQLDAAKIAPKSGAKWHPSTIRDILRRADAARGKAA